MPSYLLVHSLNSQPLFSFFMTIWLNTPLHCGAAYQILHSENTNLSQPMDAEKWYQGTELRFISTDRGVLHCCKWWVIPRVFHATALQQQTESFLHPPITWWQRTEHNTGRVFCSGMSPSRMLAAIPLRSTIEEKSWKIQSYNNNIQHNLINSIYIPTSIPNQPHKIHHISHNKSHNIVAPSIVPYI